MPQEQKELADKEAALQGALVVGGWGRWVDAGEKGKRTRRPPCSGALVHDSSIRAAVEGGGGVGGLMQSPGLRTHPPACMLRQLMPPICGLLQPPPTHAMPRRLANSSA